VTEYYATARATSSPNAPAGVSLTAATNLTVLQVATPSTTDIMILGWGVSFNGAAGGTQVPVTCWLADDSVGQGTLTAYTPDNWGNSMAPASLCVGGTSATGYNSAGTAYATSTSPRYLDSQYVSPQAGYAVLWQDDRQPKVAASRFVRLNCNAPATVSVIPWILWAEPAV
jgi:hypothetical protein